MVPIYGTAVHFKHTHPPGGGEMLNPSTPPPHPNLCLCDLIKERKGRKAMLSVCACVLAFPQHLILNVAERERAEERVMAVCR